VSKQRQHFLLGAQTGQPKTNNLRSLRQAGLSEPVTTLGFKGLEIRSRPLSFSDQAAGSRPSATIIVSGMVFSTTTVSTTAAIGCCTFRAAFLTGARLGFVLATVRFLVADFATLRALPRLAEFALRNVARF
jgi:hypothetical protein